MVISNITFHESKDDITDNFKCGDKHDAGEDEGAYWVEYLV